MSMVQNGSQQSLNKTKTIIYTPHKKQQNNINNKPPPTTKTAYCYKLYENKFGLNQEQRRINTQGS